VFFDLVPGFEDDEGVPWLSLSQAGVEVVAVDMNIYVNKV
jgi:hypothetical protein